MDWKRLDLATRIGLGASVMAVLGMLIPPVSVLSAVVAIGVSGFAWWRSRRRGEPNTIARSCVIGCLAVVAFLVIGNAIYAADT